jgi:DNA-binding HxlR family transcriptional regulator
MGSSCATWGSRGPTLSARLRTLVDAGLLERVRCATEPDLYEYRPRAA